jgi:hypothetical protein
MNAETDKPDVWAETTYFLLFPVTVEGADKVASLTFSEPNGEQLEAIDDIGLEEGANPKIGQIMTMISIMSGTPIETVRKMHAKDIKGAAEAFSPLLEGVI